MTAPPLIYTSPLPDVETPEIAITAYVLRRAIELADRAALIDGADGRTITYGELRNLIYRFAGGLAARGFGPTHTLAILAPNVPEYAVVFHGTAVAGGTVTTLNPTYTADEIRHQLQDSGATILITVGAVLDVARAAIEDTKIEEVFVIGDAEGATSLTALFGDPIEQVTIDTAEHVAVVPYSSGTTGLSKGVMLTHRNLVANLAQIEPIFDFDDGDVALAALPVFHIYGMQVLMNGLLAQGCTIVTMARFDFAQALALIEQHKISRFFAVPPMILGLAKHPLVEQHDLSSLKLIFSGAAPLGAELEQEASRRVGCEVTQGYGMTELSPVSHASLAGQGKAGTVGVTVPNAECRIVDENGVDQGVDGVGEVWVRGPLVMKGYLNSPEATAATIDADGWLHTGDVGRFDADGYLSIVDRVKELIKYKGFQVPPAELEALLITHPAVADVAVIGVPDVEAGELPKAFVVITPGAEVSDAELIAFVKERVASYKQIRMVERIAEIPKSASGKILRRLLRDGTAT
ncbi:MAG TPA: AMP-binding protein [Acidimicrobiales bacterium]|nr:AMP-binding protein [Acidimicrobiales bacterium]